jgi:hypothetical protein
MIVSVSPKPGRNRAQIEIAANEDELALMEHRLLENVARWCAR